MLANLGISLKVSFNEFYEEDNLHLIVPIRLFIIIYYYLISFVIICLPLVIFIEYEIRIILSFSKTDFK